MAPDSLAFRIAFTIIVFGFSGSYSARAHWQYTRWGMLPAEVVKASNGKAVPAKQPQRHSAVDARNVLDSTYKAEGFDFDVRFLFDDGNKLKIVHLGLSRSDQCGQLMGRLSNTYGRAEESNSEILSIAKWWDKKNGNVIALVSIGGASCTLQYSEYKEPGAKGGL